MILHIRKNKIYQNRKELREEVGKKEFKRLLADKDILFIDNNIATYEAEIQRKDNGKYSR